MENGLIHYYHQFTDDEIREVQHIIQWFIGTRGKRFACGYAKEHKMKPLSFSELSDLKTLIAAKVVRYTTTRSLERCTLSTVVVAYCRGVLWQEAQNRRRNFSIPISDKPVRDNAHNDLHDFSLKSESKEIAIEALLTVEPRRRKILMYRYGLFGFPQLTLDQVAEIYGVSRERIRQLQDSAIERIRDQPVFTKVQSHCC